MYSARSMSVAGLPCFTVSGGPFAKDQIMGWQITDEGGITCAVSCDSQLCRKIKAIEDAEAVRRLLNLLEQLQKGEDPE